MLDFQSITILSFLLLFVAIVYFLIENDELPLILTLLYLSSGLYRFWAVAQGNAGWVNVAYARDIFEMTDELGLRALNFFLEGTAVFTISYIIFKWMIKPPRQTFDNPEIFKRFIFSKKTLIISLFVIFTVATFYSRLSVYSLLGQGVSISTNISYLYYLPFALSGIILLMFLLYKNMTFKRDSLVKGAVGATIIFLGYISYNPLARFSFLSWAIALTLLYLKDRSPWRKGRIYLALGMPLFLVFSIAGLYRTPGAILLPFETQVEMAFDRFKKAEDQNLLDGMMMVLQVYPENLPFQYGMQHLEILIRPIPRLIWPNKPKGGYANKLGLNENMQNESTVGISETLYGTFYGEGGVYGILVLSILYGLLYAKIIRNAERFNSDIQYLIKGMIFASTTALIRGGDLAGIIAFVGMSYWPVILLIRQYRGFTTRFQRWYMKFLRLQRSSLQNAEEVASATSI